jgi:LacI family transcriptional regulator
MRDVAALAGVSLKTVSRVVNGEPNVSDELISRVMSATEALRYLPDASAANLARRDRETRTIALLIASVRDPFSSSVFRGVEQVSSQRGFAVFAASTEGNPQTAERLIRAFLSRNVDGLIITPTRQDYRSIADLIGLGRPTVYVDRTPLGIAADVVTTNNRAAARAATEHLLSQGHRRVALVTDYLWISTAYERKAGYEEAMEAAGLSVDPDLMAIDVGQDTQAEAAIEKLLALEDPPTAIFASRNVAEVGAIRVLKRRGLSHSIALVGMDDVELMDVVDPPVTVVRQDPVAIGRMAAERLFARLDGDVTPPQRFIMEAELVIRGSGEIAPGGGTT